MATRADLANAIRALSMDAVEKAKSGHPGAPMGMAEIAEVVWNHHLRHNPANPKWADSDRFVLSNGHGSMLIYSLLHLTGYDVTIDDLKNFRQLHSRSCRSLSTAAARRLRVQHSHGSPSRLDMAPSAKASVRPSGNGASTRVAGSGLSTRSPRAP